MKSLCTFILFFYKLNCSFVQVEIWASGKINKEARSRIGKWDVHSLSTTSSDFYGPEKSGRDNDVPRHVKFVFRNSVRCQIIWITLSLGRPGSSSFNLEQDYNLLSLDESPFTELDRRASFGGRVEGDRCIHAKRLLVFGSSVKKEMAPLSSSLHDNEKMNVKAWLERPPQLNRFRVI